MPHTIQENLDFLASLEFFGIKLGLEQTAELFERIGNPHLGLRFIHVAGSNGKGSVCALLESALRRAGFRTGFYSSPHLVNVEERFKINGADVPAEALSGAIERIRPAIADMAAHDSKVTYFEAATAIAALLFADAKVEIVLWEVGMGGRLDSTNIVTPLVSVITGISMEHAERLGGTLDRIGFEKAGIIKPHVPVFCADATPDEAKKVILARADELQAPWSGSSPIHENIPVKISLAEDLSAAWQTFSLCDGTTLQTPLMGPHQRRNAALAHAVLKYLAPVLNFDLNTALDGFHLTRWDARFQFFPEKKLVIDAAHNPEGAAVLADALREVFPGRKFHFLFGAFSDKDTRDGLAALAPLALSFRFIHMNTMRASRTTDELAAELHAVAPGIPCDGAPLETALTQSYPDGNWRILCGSLHLCGDALPYLRTNP